MAIHKEKLPTAFIQTPVTNSKFVEFQMGVLNKRKWNWETQVKEKRWDEKKGWRGSIKMGLLNRNNTRLTLMKREQKDSKNYKHFIECFIVR